MRLPWVSTLVLLAACAAPGAPDAVGGRADASPAADAASDAEPDALATSDVPVRPDVPVGADAPAAEAAVDAAPSAYPAGPYGSAVGSVVADLRWEGYVNDAHEDVSTQLGFGPTSMGAARATGAPFALVHLSGFL